MKATRCYAIRMMIAFFILHSQFSIAHSQVKFNIIQINDVYEIAGLQNGTIGDMARVAALKKQYEKKNPHTWMVLSGDFVSPSALNKVQFEGDAMEGRQMVDVMNAAGVDFVTFGNHEFDIKEKYLLKRIEESEFTWISSNVNHLVNGKPVPFVSKDGHDFPQKMIHGIENKKGQKCVIGWFGVTLPFNQAAYVSYEDIYESGKETVEELKDECDYVVGITHLSREMDSILAQKVSGIDLILGGHEHEWMKFYSGKTLVTKADANAKTAWVHQFNWNPKTKQMKLKSTLVPINSKITPDPEVEKRVQGWMDVAFDAMKKSGFDPREVVLKTTEELDGREASIRNSQTNLGTLVAEACQWYSPNSEAVFYNAGSIRVDDILTGEISQYDILRTLPFGGSLVEMTLTGKQLDSVLFIGTVTNKGIGGYFQMGNLELKNGQWNIGGKPIEKSATYKILVASFLAGGGEANLGFLKNYPSAAPTGTRDGVKNDIRNIVIEYLKRPQP